MLETTIQYVITIRYNFLQKYLLYFRPCICIHRFADISFAASYRRYRVVRRHIYDIVKPRYLAFGIVKRLTIYDNNDSKTIEKSKKKKKMVHRSRNNKREHNRGMNVWFGKHVANQQKHSFQVLSRLMNEKRSATFKAILHAAGGATIAQRFRERGGQGGLEERESGGGGEKEIKGTQKDRGTLCWVA